MVVLHVICLCWNDCDISTYFEADYVISKWQISIPCMWNTGLSLQTLIISTTHTALTDSYTLVECPFFLYVASHISGSELPFSMARGFSKSVGCLTIQWCFWLCWFLVWCEVLIVVCFWFLFFIITASVSLFISPQVFFCHWYTSTEECLCLVLVSHSPITTEW